MTVSEAIKQMRKYDRDFLIAIVLGLMFEDNGSIVEDMELDEINIIRMENMQELFESNS